MSRLIGTPDRARAGERPMTANHRGCTCSHCTQRRLEFIHTLRERVAKMSDWDERKAVFAATLRRAEAAHLEHLRTQESSS